MKSNVARTLTAVGVLVIVTIGFVTNAGIGTLSAIGWSDFSLLCPLGALGTMLASKMLVPRAVISLIFAILFIVVFARAFCGWLCPVPLVQKARGLFAKKPSKKAMQAQLTPESELSEHTAVDRSLSASDTQATVTSGGSASSENVQVATVVKKSDSGSDDQTTKLTKAEEKALKGCGSGSCTSCAERRGKVVDSRHFVLGGSLLSAAIFGFPVFCLICPIGLSFATILLVIRLFSGGDVTWSLIVVPFILIAEVVLFKKWCGKLCPLSAFMSLFGKANRTFKPQIEDKTCLETAKGRACGVCAKVCPEGIDPRHPERGNEWSECTKCRACIDACPTKSITMPLLPRKKGNTPQKGGVVTGVVDTPGDATDGAVAAAVPVKTSVLPESSSSRECV